MYRSPRCLTSLIVFTAIEFTTDCIHNDTIFLMIIHRSSHLEVYRFQSVKQISEAVIS